MKNYPFSAFFGTRTVQKNLGTPQEIGPTQTMHSVTATCSFESFLTVFQSFMRVININMYTFKCFSFFTKGEQLK